MSRSLVMNYFVVEYFNDDVEAASAATGYKISQLNSWISGKVQPHKQTIEYLVHCAIAPEFKVVCEFKLFSPDKPIKKQLRSALSGHVDRPGIYAFYDSMANLLYVGKASNLLEEMYQSIRQKISTKFPTGLPQAPDKRYEVVRYISAYDVGQSEWLDYPLHVESLILRISKPPLNQRIGKLAKLEVS